MLSEQNRTYLQSMADRIRAASAELDRVSAFRDDAIRVALDTGAGPTELAHIFGLTPARIYQIKGKP